MKLLGAELVNFACFERQFVPLRPGINLLVGRNNAGKTASLRGLSAVAGLFPGAPGAQAISAELAGYCHRSGVPTYGLEVLYRLDESDDKFFFQAPSDWLLKFVPKSIARWRFVVFASNRQVGFVECGFELPVGSGVQQVVHIGKSQDGNALHSVLQYPGLQERGSSRLSVQTFQGPDGRYYPVFKTEDEFWAPLQQFGTVRLISAHRVVAPRDSLQTAFALPSDARNLASFLQTLQGNDRGTFEQIERFVTTVFPEFRYLNATSLENNQVAVYLTERETDRKIPLENCGTGVEQIVTLATFVLTTPKPGTILLDEPHSYLHPTAERALVQFFREHSEHCYVVSTHSAVLMNSVAADRILHISPPGEGYKALPDQAEVSGILFDLGYRNSDALFHDRLVCVEGKSDKHIIPLLLEKDGEIEPGELDRTGFPILEGSGRGSTGLQVSILRYEKLLRAVGRGNQPRIYVLDGDRRGDEKAVLEGTKNPITGQEVPVRFLPRLEIENYLLVPEAIASAVREELVLKGQSRDVSASEIETRLQELLENDDEHIFPQGREEDGDPFQEAKGSVVLERVYDAYGLTFNKERSGVLIAKHVSAKSQPAISELTNLLRPLFAKNRN